MAVGHGKVILLGEHGVVYGRPALAAGLERGVAATANVADTDDLFIRPWDVHVTPGTEGEELARALSAVLDLYPGERAKVHIEAEVDLPAGAGLGCSAALGVAVVGAVDEALGVERKADERAEASLAWERVFHGTPSGVDSAMAAHGGVAVFRKEEPLEEVTVRQPLKLVIGNSGEPSSTKLMVAEVRRQHERAEERIEKVFDGMASIVQNGRLAVQAGDMGQLGKLMTLNQALLNTLMVSTARLEEMCALARSAGALGAKLTGAGGGGCMIALVDDDGVAAAVAKALRADLDVDSFAVEVT
jgi:mevalonate kinase